MRCHPWFAAPILTLFVCGCSLPSPPTTARRAQQNPTPVAEETQRSVNKGSKAKTSVPPSGRVGFGLLAKHFDRDGDGVFEEAVRGSTIYFDRNGDQVADLVVRGNPPLREAEWDEDFDGVLDHAVTSDEGTQHGWSDCRRIHDIVPGIFKQDHIVRTEARRLEEPHVAFWQMLLGL